VITKPGKPMMAGGHVFGSCPLASVGVALRSVSKIFRSEVRTAGCRLMTGWLGDNSGSHRAGTLAAVQAPPGRVTAVQRLVQLHPDSSRLLSESYGMQEVRSSSLRSSTGQRHVAILK